MNIFLFSIWLKMSVKISEFEKISDVKLIDLQPISPSIFPLVTEKISHCLKFNAIISEFQISLELWRGSLVHFSSHLSGQLGGICVDV